MFDTSMDGEIMHVQFNLVIIIFTQLALSLAKQLEQ